MEYLGFGPGKCPGFPFYYITFPAFAHRSAALFFGIQAILKGRPPDGSRPFEESILFYFMLRVTVMVFTLWPAESFTRQ